MATTGQLWPASSTADATGTTILSGTATPTAGVGNVGDYYLDTDNNILYGPKPPAAIESYVTPTLSTIGGSGPSGQVFGAKFQFLANGTVTGIRIRPSTAGPMTGWEVYLWKDDGTLLASKDAPTLTAGTWNLVNFDTPVSVTAGPTYVVGYWVAPNGELSIGSSHAGLVSGNVSALANATLYSTGPRDSFPTTTWNSTTIGISPVHTSSGAWPVALTGASGAAGSTILSGTATPTAGTGNVGDYYLDTDDHVLYGPKANVAGFGPQEVAYTSQTPNNGTSNTNDVAGADVLCAVAGEIAELRYYRHATTTDTTRTLRLWSSAGAQLAVVTTAGDSGTGWKSGVLTTPVPVSAGQTVRVSMDSPHRLAWLSGTGAAFTNGNLTQAVQYWHTGITTGRPTTVTAAAWIFLDVGFRPVANPWPVSVYGVPPGGTTGQVLKKTSGIDYAVGWVT